MNTRFCCDDYELDSPQLGRLTDSSDAVGDPQELQRRLAEHGYLYLKNFLDRDAVLKARDTILRYMDEHEGLEPGSRPLDGVMGQYGQAVPMMGRPITQHDDVLAVLESPRLFELYGALFGKTAMTYPYKWLRAVGNEEATGCHMDHVYMGRGSKHVMTCWVPFDDLPVKQGTLAICEDSHAGPAFEKLRNTYGKMDVDRDKVEGWFTKKPHEITETFGGRWVTDDVAAGDIITFGMHLMHASTTNTTDRWRLSCDIRFQPETDTTDQRWVGQNPTGHSFQGQPKPIAQARADWGV